jgi:Zn ribbon nucleic-acid-binding protein
MSEFAQIINGLHECAKIIVMGIFKRKKTGTEQQIAGLVCPHCGSTNTGLQAYHGSDHPDYVRVWRGQRVSTHRCSDCGMEFYDDVRQDEATDDDSIVYDAEALRAAEEELKKEIDDANDRRCW